MTEDTLLSEKDFKNCADFHGHICPGLSIGYRAARAGLDWLKEHRALDEELVAIVETNSCSTDAIQVLTGCTFGKGNLIFKDHGKHVFTLLGRQTGRGVRLSLKPGVISLNQRHRELFQKIKSNSASEKEREEFLELHRQKSAEILEKPLEEMFTINPAQTALPAKAEIEPSNPCEECGEPTMRTKLVEKHGRSLCKDCRAKMLP
ncbi:MAG: TraR/DksA C4-type zinc finger protein [Deltaproteobacteria bacterium]|nr:TraR/DksA C4-type zinc finger protein [Deltaproteobacteria bacterium]